MKILGPILLGIVLLPLLGMAKQQTIFINSTTQPCITATGVSTQCLQYKEKRNQKYWQLLQEPIAGFTFEPGYLYTVRIKTTNTTKPTNKKSLKNWRLVKLVAKVKAPENEEGELIGYDKGIGGGWTFQQLIVDGKTISLTTQKETIHFNPATNQVNGKASCNNFFGSYTLKDTTITIGPLGSTMMACPELATEQQLMKALDSVTAWEVKDNTLHLKANGKTVLQLTRLIKKTI